jgi:hypothetical protein
MMFTTARLHRAACVVNPHFAVNAERERAKFHAESREAFCVAEARLAEFLRGHRETRRVQANASSAKLTFGTAAELLPSEAASELLSFALLVSYFSRLLYFARRAV